MQHAGARDFVEADDDIHGRQLGRERRKPRIEFRRQAIGTDGQLAHATLYEVAACYRLGEHDELRSRFERDGLRHQGRDAVEVGCEVALLGAKLGEREGQQGS